MIRPPGRIMIGLALLVATGPALAGPVVCRTAARASTQPPVNAQAPTDADTDTDADSAPVPLLPIEIIARYPHDKTAFTEGLAWVNGHLYESVGRKRQSDVRRVRLTDGKVLARQPIAPRHFGEGLTYWQKELVSLTWTEGVAYRWNADTLAPRRRQPFAGEGWGLASDGNSLVQSDGSATLRFLDPVTLAERCRITVTANGKALRRINELEFVRGALFANIWYKSYIVRIAPDTGKVTGLIDLSAIVAEIGATDHEAVANGIAWDEKGDRLFVTGKLWPTLFEIKLLPEAAE